MNQSISIFNVAQIVKLLRMSANRLKLNKDKTELAHLDRRQEEAADTAESWYSTDHITVADSLVFSASSSRHICHLAVTSSPVSGKCFFQTRQLCQLRRSLDVWVSRHTAGCTRSAPQESTTATVCWRQQTSLHGPFLDFLSHQFSVWGYFSWRFGYLPAFDRISEIIAYCIVS